MRSILQRFFFLAAAGVLLSSPLAAQQVRATLDGYISDEAGVLSKSFEEDMNTRLSELEDALGMSVVIATAPGLEGASSVAYASRFGEKLAELGRVKKEWVVFALVPADREFSISMSFSLPAPPGARAIDTLTDEQKREFGQLIGETFTSAVRPKFVEDRWEKGMRSGVDALEAMVANGEAIEFQRALNVEEEPPT